MIITIKRYDALSCIGAQEIPPALVAEGNNALPGAVSVSTNSLSKAPYAV